MPKFVLVVSGLPGAGKSTLSRRLGADLGLVVVCRDRLQTLFTDIRAVLADADRADLLGASGDALVNHVVDAVLDAGHGVVVDGNFNWQWQRDAVRRLVAERRPPGFEVRLWGDVTALRRRWLEREPDLAILPDMAPILDAAYSRPKEFVLDASYGRVEFDTTDFTTLDAAYPELLSRLRDRIEPSQLVG